MREMVYTEIFVRMQDGSVKSVIHESEHSLSTKEIAEVSKQFKKEENGGI